MHSQKWPLAALVEAEGEVTEAGQTQGQILTPEAADLSLISLLHNRPPLNRVLRNPKNLRVKMSRRKLKSKR